MNSHVDIIQSASYSPHLTDSLQEAMAQIYYERDAKIEDIADLSVGIIGYGNQGRAHALNLRDSGVNVRVGAREGGNAFQQAYRPVQAIIH